MSSDSNVEVSPLELGGHRKEKPIVRRIRQEHGTLILSLPEKLGLKLNQEVLIEMDKSNPNPLKWEVKIRLKSREAMKEKDKGLQKIFSWIAENRPELVKEEYLKDSKKK